MDVVRLKVQHKNKGLNMSRKRRAWGKRDSDLITDKVTSYTLVEHFALQDQCNQDESQHGSKFNPITSGPNNK